MKTKRRQAREIVLKLLYQIDTAGIKPEEALNSYLEVLFGEDENNDEESNKQKQKLKPALSPDVKTFVSELFMGTVEHMKEIDAIIAHLSSNWRLERMAVIDRNILRFSAYEIIYRKDIPIKVTIDEAVEIAKKYSSADSSRFINGILDSLAAYIGRKPTAIDSKKEETPPVQNERNKSENCK